MRKLRLFPLALVALFSLLSFASCSKNKTNTPVPVVNENETVNKWVYNTMSTYYLWNDQLPQKTSFDGDPNDFFHGLLYNPGTVDRFSWILDNSQKNKDMLNGVNESFGFEFILEYADDSKKSVIGIVEYTLPNSPIAQTQVVRGNFFTKIDNIVLTPNNYQDLLSKKSATYTFINQKKQTFDVPLTKEVVKSDPVYLSKIIDTENARVGYLVYNEFTADNGDGSNAYTTELMQAFANFKSQGVTEFVLDLRYNGGGLISLSNLISSFLVPSVNTNKINLYFRYNTLVSAQLSEDQKVLNYENKPDQYIGNNIHRLFVLTGSGTASASEAVINGLRPYMTVTTIGETTYGKNVGSVTFSDDQKRFDWIIQPIIMQLYNSKHESDYTAGFAPNYAINEWGTYPAPALGSVDEPLLKQALAIISGQMATKHSMLSTSTKKEVIFNSLNRQLNLPMKQISL